MNFLTVRNKIFLKFMRLTTWCCSKTLLRVRKKVLSCVLKAMGTSFVLKSGVIIEYPEHVSVGNGVSIQNLCFISGYGGIRIGNDVSLGNSTKIFSSEHPYTSKVHPFKYEELEKRPVEIGNNVITGSGVIILGGVHIGDNVMIGAGSVVTKDVPSNVVIAGNPAKVIKNI